MSVARHRLRRLDQVSAAVPYVVAIADLDHFKQLNDTFGHECGDRVLAAVGQRLRDGLRAGDSVGRWGGEEFIFVIEQSTLADAAAAMDRVRIDLAHPIPCAGHSHEVTMSVGITDAQPDRMVHRALQRADAGPPPVTGAQAPPRRRHS
jgi:diguanylate cyclase (GGDEF)-like protein